MVLNLIIAGSPIAPIVIDNPARLVEMTVEQTQYMRDPDGITAHAVIIVHALTD